MVPDSHRDILDAPGFAHMATIGPDGEPQVNPVWYEFDGEFLLFSQTKDRQKYRNVQREPRVAASITDPDNAYRRLELRGMVKEIEEDADRTFINRLAKKYMGQDEYPYHQPGDERVVVKVKPEHTTTMG